MVRIVVSALFPFSLLCASALFVSAFPIQVSGGNPDIGQYPQAPHRARSLAFDEVKRRYIAFDFKGREIGTYSISHSQKRDAPPAGSCQTLSSDDVQKCSLFIFLLPLHNTDILLLVKGWQTLVNKAKQNWGGGSYNVSLPALSVL